MPQVKYQVHFGVLEEDKDTVIPGVVGVETRLGGGTWTDWFDDDGYSNVPDEHPGLEGLHIVVDTYNPQATVMRIMSNYGSVLIPRKYDDADYLGSMMITTTRGIDFDRQTEGCIHVIRGYVAPPVETDEPDDF